MWPVWRFEIKKRNRRWPVWLLIGVLTAVLAGGFVRLQQQRSQYVQTYRTQLEKLSHSAVYTLGQELTAFKQSPAAYSHWFYESLRVRSGEKQGTKAISGVGWRIPNGDELKGMQLLSSTFLTIKAYQLMQKRHITPMRPDSLILSADDLGTVSPDTVKFLRRNNQFFYEKAWYYIWDLVQQNVVFLLLAVGLIVTGRQWAKEVANRNVHSNWLRLQGAAFSKQLLVEFGVIGYTLGQIVFIPIVLMGIIIGIIQGFGALDYPVVAFGDTGLGFGPLFIELGQYLGQALLLSIGLILFLTAVNLVLADWLRNSWVVTALQLILLAVAWIAPPMRYSPLTYFKLDPVITGTLAKQMDNAQYTTGLGLGVLIGSSAILIVLMVVSRLIQGWLTRRPAMAVAQ